MRMGKDDGLVVCVGDNEELFLKGAQAFIKVSGFPERCQGILITMDRKNWKKNSSCLLQSLVVDLHRVGRQAVIL